MIKVGCCANFGKKALSLDLLEVQATFYKIPKEETLKRWRERAPKEFEFSIKASQCITHPPSSPTYRKAGITPSKDMGFFKDTEEVYKAYEETKKCAKILGARFILFQTPHSFTQEKAHIRALCKFFENIERDGFLFALEVRGWDEESVKSICKDLKIIECTDPFSHLPQKGEIAYFRLHGSPPGDRLYRYKYKEEDLLHLLSLCREYKEVYCLFNNIYMWEDALHFKRMMYETKRCVESID